MIAALRDTTLSTCILEVVKKVLPYTLPGAMMPSDVASDVVERLAGGMKLASLMEQELSVHRLGEAGMTARAVIEREIKAALDESVGGTVVKVDFDGGRKK